MKEPGGCPMPGGCTCEFPPWEDISTAPEGVAILCYASWEDEDRQIYVDRFFWCERVISETESVTHTKTGRRTVIQERTERYREWKKYATPDKWMPCPPIPTKA